LPALDLPSLRPTDHARLDIQGLGWKALKLCDFREYARSTLTEKGELLVKAATLGDSRAVKVLLSERADIEFEDDRNLTSLMRATINHHASVVTALIKRGANPNVKDDRNTPLLEWTTNGNMGMVNLLLKNGVDISAKDKKERTALHIASISGREDITLALVKSGANINAKDKNGNTALMEFAKNGNEAMARFLLENGGQCERADKPWLDAIARSSVERPYGSYASIGGERGQRQCQK
jgi:ankyrin repeat protein